MREITVTTKVQLPRVPNFILLDGSKSDGAKLDVADLSDGLWGIVFSREKGIAIAFGKRTFRP